MHRSHWAPLVLLLPLAACSSDDDSVAANLFDGYANSSLSVPARLPIADQAPLNSSGAIIGFTVSPALPDGLAIDSDSGVISGTPTGLAVSTLYTVTAANGSDSDSETITIEVRNPVVGLTSDVPLTRNVNGAGSPLTASGAGIGVTGTAPVASTLAITEVDTPTDAADAVVATSDAVMASADTVPTALNLTQDFTATVSIDDTELSGDPWAFAAQAPYDDDGLVPAQPSFPVDTSTVVLEDGALALDVSLASPSIPAFSSGSLPTAVQMVNPLITPVSGMDSQWLALDGAFYFAMETPTVDIELHRYDPDGGMSGGPSFELVVDLDPSIDGDVNVQGALAGRVILSMNNTEATPRNKSYAYDPVADELVQIADLRPGADDSNSNFVELDGNLYFRGETASEGAFVHRYTFSDGVNPATLERISSTSEGVTADEPTDLTVVGGMLYFRANDDMDIQHLYRFDPLTSTQTRLSSDQNAPIIDLFGTGTDLYASASSSMGGEKLFRWDETSSALQQISNTAADQAVDDNVGIIAELQGDLYFQAEAMGQSKLFRYRPNAVPAALEQISNTTGDGNEDDDIGEALVVGDILFFVASNPAVVEKLWFFDPSSGETRQAFDINGPTTSDIPCDLIAVGTGQIALAADGGSGNLKLFIYDMATEEATLAADLNPGNDDDTFTLVDDGGRLIFSAVDPSGDVAAYVIE